MADRARKGGGLDLALGVGSRWTWRERAQLPILVPFFAVLLAALYWRIGGELIERVWYDDNYSHSLLVPFFSGFLIWRRRAELRALAPHGSWVGLPVLLAGLGALLLGDIATEDFLMRSSFMVILTGLVLLHLGREILRMLAFPLAFLLFAVPLPAIFFHAIAFPLQNLAAQNAMWTLELLGIPVLREGNVIHLGQVTLGVTEAFGGVRSLLSLVCLAVGWGYLTVPGTWGIIGLAAAAVPCAIVANAARVVITGLIAQGFGIRSAQEFFDVFSGWAIFVVAFACLAGIQGLIHLVRRRGQG